MLNTAHKNRNAVIQDSDVEWRVLGALLEPTNLEWVNRISPAIFTDGRDEVFRAIQMAFTDYGTITFEGLNKHLQGKIPGELTASQGAEIRSAVDEAMRIATKRQLYERSLLLHELSTDFSPNQDKIREALDMPPIMADQDSSMLKGVRTFLGNLHAKQTGDYHFAHTGLSFLDHNLGGEWKPKALIGILGGPGSGKTALVGNSMLRMADNVNRVTGEPEPVASLMFSLEMAHEDLVVRWQADMLSIDSKRLQLGNLTDDELQAIEHASIALQRKPMYIIDDGKITLAQIVYEIRKHVQKHKVRVVFIDYLQILNHAPTGNRNNDLGEVAQVLKSIAKRENITIVLLSQVTPGNTSIFRFRDSGEVGAVVDAAFELSLDDDVGPVKNMVLEGHKNRFGMLTKTAIQFVGPYQRFEAAIV